MTNMQDNDDFSPVLFPPLNDSDDDNPMSRQLQENFTRLRKRKSSSSDDEQERKHLAIETALLVNEQVERMKSSIAELERVLQKHPDEASSAVSQQQPPLMMVVVHDDDDTDNNEDEEHERLPTTNKPLGAATTTTG